MSESSNGEVHCPVYKITSVCHGWLHNCIFGHTSVSSDLDLWRYTNAVIIIIIIIIFFAQGTSFPRDLEISKV